MFQKNIFWSRGGLQHNAFLLKCVLQNVESYRFCFAPFGQILVNVQKTLENRYGNTFLKEKRAKTKLR